MGQPDIGFLLRKAWAAYHARIVSYVRANGFEDVTPALAEILPLIGSEPVRAQDFAMRANRSKQAMSQLIKQLEQRGYIARTVDPNDARATVLTLTDRGREMKHVAGKARAELEHLFQDQLTDGDALIVQRALSSFTDLVKN